MVKLSGAVLGLVGILVMAIAPRTQEDDSKAQIAALQKELKACGAVMQVQERTLKELDRRLKAVEGWFQGVPTALGALDNGLKECESSGFTNAGANPRAREALLEALKGLATNLKMGLPAPHAAKDK